MTAATEPAGPADTAGPACVLHLTHRPQPLTLVTHHVVPIGMKGPDDPSNRVEVCDTGHRNVHLLLAALVYGQDLGRRGTPTERALAWRGYDTWVKAGRQGNPHAAYALHGSGGDHHG